MMFSPGPFELAVVFLLVLLIFGPGKLPEVCQALGKGFRQFKSASTGAQEALEKAQVELLKAAPTAEPVTAEPQKTETKPHE